MKTYLFILIVLTIFFQNTNAQVSQVFPTDSAEWKLLYRCIDGGSDIWFYEHTLTAVEDSVMNDIHYGQLDDGGAVFYENPKIIVNGDKVFYKDENLTQDSSYFLAFDFGLEVGDIFNYPDFLNYYSNTITIESVDTVQFSDGVFRKRLKLSEPYWNICGETLYWVEGIGGMPNPFYFYNCFECSVANVKFYQNDELVVTEVIIANEDIIDASKVKVFPNPTSDIFYVESDKFTIKEITISELAGREIVKKEVGKKVFEFQIPSSLAKGIYTLKLKLNNQGIVVKKLIVH